MTSHSKNLSIRYPPKLDSTLNDSLAQENTSVMNFSDTTLATTSAAMHRSSRNFPPSTHSLAAPPQMSTQRLDNDKSRENFSPSKPANGGGRDRYITRANFSMGQPGGLAEVCGHKINRVLEYGNAPVIQPKYAASDFISLYAPQVPNKRAMSTSTRKIPNKPAKILDAPGIVDDFYANIIDWSKSLDLMAIGLGSTVYCWDPQTSAVSLIAELDPEGNGATTVTSVKWSTEDTCLGVATSRGEVQIWDASSGRLVRTMRGRNCERIAALSWNEPILSSGGRNGSIWNHDIRIKNHKVAELRSHSGEVCGLQWRDDGRMLASGGNDNLVALWDARVTSVPKHQIHSHQAAVKALAWCPWHSNLLATGGGSADRQIHFWNAATGHSLNTIDAGSQVTSLHWNDEYREISASLGYPYNSISVWSYPSLHKQVEISGAHDSRILNSTLSMDGQTLVTCSADENIKFWDIFQTGSQNKQQYEFQGMKFGSAFAPGRV